MLVVDFDPTRPRDEGQFHVRLIDGKSGDYGNDARRQNQLGYWCDIGHLRSGVLASVDAAIKRYEEDRHRQIENRLTDKAVDDAIDGWYSANYAFGVRLRSQERADLAHYIAQRLGLTRSTPSPITSAQSEQHDDPKEA